jgi:hypothetical protein
VAGGAPAERGAGFQRGRQASIHEQNQHAIVAALVRPLQRVELACINVTRDIASGPVGSRERLSRSSRRLPSGL